MFHTDAGSRRPAFCDQQAEIEGSRALSEFRRLSKLWPWLKPYRWLTLGLLLGSLAVYALALLPPVIMAGLIDRALPSGSLRGALLVVAGYFSIILLNHVFNVLAEYAYTLVGSRISADLQRHMLERVLRADLRYHFRLQAGDLLARVTADVELVRTFLSQTTVNILANVLTLFVALGVMTWFNWKLALGVLLFLPLIPVPFRWMGTSLRQTAIDQRRANGANTAFLQEMVSGVLPIQIAGAEGDVIERQRVVVDRLIQATLRMRLRQMMAGYIAEIGGNVLSPLLVLSFGSYLVLQRELTVGQLVASQMYAVQLIAPVVSLSKIRAAMHGVLAALDRVEEVLGVAQRFPGRARDDGESPSLETDGLRAENVSFSYGVGPVLHRVSLHAPRGGFVCIVGPSGSGKSTLAYLLSGVFAPDAGTVSLNGREISTLNGASSVTLVPQEPFLFHATVRENLCFGLGDIPQADIQRAAEAAAIGTFIRALPDRYSTVIGERGATVSGGERQRLMLARAFLVRPVLLVLDEVTSALDPSTEQVVLRALDALRPESTVVLVTHRFTTAMSADWVYVMDGGQIVEEGPPDELLAQGGAFARLHADQAAKRLGRPSGPALTT